MITLWDFEMKGSKTYKKPARVCILWGLWVNQSLTFIQPLLPHSPTLSKAALGSLGEIKGKNKIEASDPDLKALANWLGWWKVIARKAYGNLAALSSNGPSHPSLVQFWIKVGDVEG